MGVFVLIFYPIALVVMLYLGLRQKKDSTVRYSLLDKLSVATNVILFLVYAVASFMPMFMSMIFYPTDSADFLQVVFVWLLTAVIGAAPVYCAAAIGFSIALRRKGRSMAGFLAQFAGALGILFANLLASCFLDKTISWMNTSLN